MSTANPQRGRPKPRVYLTYRGETLTQKEWASRLGVSSACLIHRRKKWPGDIEAILGTRPRREQGFAAAVATYLAQREETA